MELKKARFWILALLLATTVAAVAQPALPQRQNKLVYDLADLLSANEERQLETNLRNYNNETSTQIVVVLEPSLGGEAAFDRSFRIADAWGIGGSSENDNGVLIYVARDDRQIRIQTGYGTEGFLPDVKAKRVIDNIISPAFRNGDFYGGIEGATSAIMDMGRGEYDASDLESEGGIPPGLIFVLILVVFIALSAMSSQDDDDDDDGGYWRGGRYDMDDPLPRRRRRRGGFVVFPGGFGNGGGGGGFGGGGGGLPGFGGFGGGGFGGGGAGGSW